MSDTNNKPADYELDWDDEINGEEEWLLLPGGTYDFEVIKFERGYHNGSDSVQACKKAELTIRITGDAGSTIVKDNFFMLSSWEWKLAQLFRSIGVAKKDDKRINMDWSRVPGANGRAEVAINEYTNKKGETRQNNKITKYYPPDYTPPQTAAKTEPEKNYTPGKF